MPAMTSSRLLQISLPRQDTQSDAVDCRISSGAVVGEFGVQGLVERDQLSRAASMVISAEAADATSIRAAIAADAATMFFMTTPGDLTSDAGVV